MSDIVELLEEELEEAFEVKNKKSLHRYVVLMVDRFEAVTKAVEQGAAGDSATRPFPTTQLALSRQQRQSGRRE